MGKTEITKIRREKWEMTRFLNDKKIFRGYLEKLKFVNTGMGVFLEKLAETDKRINRKSELFSIY